MNIVFLGTPLFALPCLEALCARGWVSDIVTQPPRPAGRGWTSVESPVAKYARLQGIRLWEPERLVSVKDNFLSLSWDVAVVVAYGKILPRWFLNHPRYGAINVHASLLPRWRGAAPIHAAMMHGDGSTGVSIMRMEDGLDEGPYWAQKSYALNEDSLFSEVHDALAHLGQEALCEVLEHKSFLKEPKTQDEAHVRYASKILPQDSHYHPAYSGIELKRRIHAFYPKPGIRAQLGDTSVRLIRAGAFRPLIPECPVGTLVSVDEEGLWIRVSDGILAITELQYASQAPKHVQQLRCGWPKHLALGSCLLAP